MTKRCLEEKTVYCRGTIDEGNWFSGSVLTSARPLSSGMIEFPLRLLPAPLQRRAKKGEHISLRLLISEDFNHTANTLIEADVARRKKK